MDLRIIARHEYEDFSISPPPIYKIQSRSWEERTRTRAKTSWGLSVDAELVPPSYLTFVLGHRGPGRSDISLKAMGWFAISRRWTLTWHTNSGGQEPQVPP